MSDRALTGSGAMLAETLHSAADCGDQPRETTDSDLVVVPARTRLRW